MSNAYTYDRRNRLTKYSVSSPDLIGLQREVEISYDVLGNILEKSYVGKYTYPASGYGTVRPGAVTSIARGTRTESFIYDVAGNLTAGTNTKYGTIGYTSFNLPTAVSGAQGASDTQYSWQYGPDYERVKEVEVSSGTTRTTWYNHPDNANGLSFEQEAVSGGGTVNRHYVSAGGQAFLVMDSNNSAPTTITTRQWWHRDQLGSIAAISNDAGVVSQRMSYDPFGKRREINGTYDEFGTLAYDYASATDRGFTGHEHLDDVGIVNMNGRMYDPNMARMMSADPLIQNADDLQNYNRYSYLTNNPLNATDPTGHFKFTKLFRAVVAVAIAIYAPQLLLEFGGAGAMCTAAGTVYGSGVTMVAHAAAGGIAALVASNGDPNAAIRGAITAGAFNAVGSAWDPATDAGANYAGHAAVGCLDGMMGGNGCGRGAASAFAGKWATNNVPRDWSKAENM